jgi:hypothetical protein
MRPRTGQARHNIKAHFVTGLGLFGNEVLNHFAGRRAAEKDGSHPKKLSDGLTVELINRKNGGP